MLLDVRFASCIDTNNHYSLAYRQMSIMISIPKMLLPCNLITYIAKIDNSLP